MTRSPQTTNQYRAHFTRPGSTPCVHFATTSPEAGTAHDLPGTDHGAISDHTPENTARWRACQHEVLAKLRATRVGMDSSGPERVLHGVLLTDLARMDTENP